MASLKTFCFRSVSALTVSRQYIVFNLFQSWFCITCHTFLHHTPSCLRHINIILRHTTGIFTTYCFTPQAYSQTEPSRTQNVPRKHPERTRSTPHQYPVCIKISSSMHSVCSMYVVVFTGNVRFKHACILHAFCKFFWHAQEFVTISKISQKRFYYGINLNSLNSFSGFFSSS